MRGHIYRFEVKKYIMDRAIRVEDSTPLISRSQASDAYEAIRADIVSGRHTPDKKLKIQDLANELSVSPGAVREALSRLVPEQLVVSRDQRGFSVAPLWIGDLEDLTDLRCEIETICLRRSVAYGDVNWEVGILASAHRLRVTPLMQSEGELVVNPSWVKAHASLHTALVAACGSRRLIALHAQLYEQSERYRGLAAHYETGRDIDHEHQQIVDMALARDADGLVNATLSHMRATTQSIVQAVKAKDAHV